MKSNNLTLFDKNSPGRLNPPILIMNKRLRTRRTSVEDLNACLKAISSEDAMATWIYERCQLKESYYDTVAELFKSWKAWAELMRESVGSAKGFSNKLQARPGIKKIKIGDSKARGYSGIRVVKIEQAARCLCVFALGGMASQAGAANTSPEQLRLCQDIIRMNGYLFRAAEVCNEKWGDRLSLHSGLFSECEWPSASTQIWRSWHSRPATFPRTEF